MGKLWAVVQREYLERVRTRWFVVVTIFGPLLFSGLLFLPQWVASRSRGSAEITGLVVIDATGRGLGAHLRQALRTPREDLQFSKGATTTPAADNTEIRVVEPSAVAAAESAATREVVAKRKQGYVVLTSGTAGGDSARYAGRNATSIGTIERIQAAVRQAVLAAELSGAGMDPSRVAELTRRSRVRMNAEQITDRGRGGSSTARITLALSVATLLYITIVLHGQSVLRGVLEEKQTRVAEVVLSSVRADTLLAGKVIGVGAVGLTQMAIWMLGTVLISSFLAPFLTRVQPGMSRAGASSAMSAFELPIGMVMLFVLFFLLGYAFYSALHAAAGSLVNSEQEAQQAAQPLIFLLVASALMIQPVLFNPGGQVARFASLLPVSAPIIMPLRLSLVPVPAIEIVTSLLLLLTACGLAVWVAGKIYRVGLLMYGKRASLREVARWLKADA